MAGLQCNKFKGDMGKIILVILIREMLLVNGNTTMDSKSLFKCYNCQEAQEAGQILDEEQLAFLADPRIPADQAQTIIPHNAAFQTEDLDTYDSDCDDLSTAQAVLMANISNYGSDIILEVPNSETYQNDIDNQSVHALQDFEQSPVMDFIIREYLWIAKIILYSLYLQETQLATIQDTNLQAQQDSMILSVIEQITLILEEESRSKMFEKAKDPEVIAKKISHKTIDYEKLNSLTDDFGKRFSPQQELSAKQAFWFHKLNPTIEPSFTPLVIVDVPSELPKVSLVNACLKKLKFHLTQFDSVVKKRTTSIALEEGEWGFEHTKAVFNNEIIPFLKSLKDIFNVFDKDLLNEITEVQIVFDQMETAVQQFSVDKECLEIAQKETLLEIDRLLLKIMSQEVMLNVMNFTFLNNDIVNMKMQKCDSCEKCLNLDAELTKSKQAYNALLKNHSQLEKHCISLKVSMQSKQEVFQNDNSCVNHNDVEIQEYFEINDLKAQLQDKDKTICKLKDTIRSLSKNAKEENVNHDKCDLEPINEELENSVATLLSENECLCNEINHVKQVFKDQFDSIKQTRVRHKEQCDSLINKLNLKSVENEDLKAQIQDKVFVITSLKNDLRKIKGKEIVENVVHIPSATTIAPSMFKLDLYVELAKAKQPSRIGVELLPIRVKCSTSNCRSKPPGNKKNDRISQKPSRNKKNYIEAQPRKVNKLNRVAKPVGDVDVTHSLSKQLLKFYVIQIVLWYLDSGCSKHMTGNRSQLMNFVSKFLGVVIFGNDQIARIMGYGDYHLGNVVISRVYYVEGIGHNLFSVGQFCDVDLEVAFRKHTCFIRNLEGVDLLSGSRDTNLYTISLDDMLRSSLICLLSKASKTKSWLWHRQLSHLNFGTLNKLAKDGLARGIPRLKFQKVHLCSSCALGKSKKSSHQPKAEDTNQ
ncbi:retrovirus-related pol polyprotein from transposon TNT 1-94 [Tanacetum coccineum]